MKAEREFLWANETASEDGILGWVTRRDGDTMAVIETLAGQQWEVRPQLLRVTEVLLREQSEVEAKIHGDDFPLYVECTTRARQSRPFWRVERVA